MQTIERILRIEGSGGSWATDWGETADTPEIAIGIRARLRFDLRQAITDDESGRLLPVNAEEVRCDCYYFVLDADHDQATSPKLIKTDGFTLTEQDGRVYLDAEIPNTAVPGLLEAVKTNPNVTLHGEIGGYMAGNTPANSEFVLQFDLLIRNRVWLGGEVPPEVSGDPEYLTAEEIKKLIEEYFRPEPGKDGTDGEPGTSAYEIAVAGGYRGTVEEWLESLRGAEGKSAYEVAVAGGFRGTEAEWLESLRGAEGKSAYELAVIDGFSGPVSAWLSSLKGERGEQGEGLHFDKTGKLSELEAYNGEPEGFVFAATVTYPEERKTELYIYVKRSGAWADWCEPLTITYYARDGKDGENVKLLLPLEFHPPEKDETYLYFSMLDYPAATIAAVCIDTEDGELRLPYNSASGIEKILKKDGTFRIYFGARVPAYQTGRVYFSQGLAGKTQYQLYVDAGGTLTYEEWLAAASLVPPPEDGKLYGMQNRNWIEIDLQGGSGGSVAFDDVGAFSERHLYDDAARGFRFLATDLRTDSQGQCYQALYQKRTDAFGDWSDAIRFYGYRGKDGQDGKDGKDGENVQLIPDIEFFPAGIELPEGALEIYGNSVTVPGIKPIAAVELYDAEGNGINIDRSDKENSVLIRTCYQEGHTVIYLGSGLDTSHGGRVRFAQGVGQLSPYQEWLKEGNTGSYEDWLALFHSHGNMAVLKRLSVNTDGKLCFDGVPVCSCTGGGEPPDPPQTETMYYGYVPYAVSGNTIKVAEITQPMLDDDRSAITATRAGTLDKTGIGNVPAGSLVVVMLPAEASLKAEKFDGVGGFTTFFADNAETGTGANGTRITLGGAEYDVYGEFCLATAEIFIRITTKE